MVKSKSLNSDNISKNRLQMDKGYTPDWDDDDLEKCEKYDVAVRAGTMTFRTIEIN